VGLRAQWGSQLIRPFELVSLSKCAPGRSHNEAAQDASPCFAVALQALSTAWTATATQYEALAQYAPEHLGDNSYLQSALQLAQATEGWRDFAVMIENFLQRIFVRP
jgi:hypothetical protein